VHYGLRKVLSCAARKATLVVPTRKATGAKLGRFPRFRPNFMQKFSKWRWWGVSRIFGRFWGAVIGTPVFFCFNHSSCNAARPLCMRCACAAHALRICCAAGTQAACWLKWGKTGTIFFLVSFLVGLIICSVGILQESIQWTGFLTCIAIITQMGRFMWSLIQVFFIVPITIYTFFWGVYDFGPKHRKITLFDILLNPVPGIEFEGRLGESDDFDSRRRR
jgi:hypothetical protein